MRYVEPGGGGGRGRGRLDLGLTAFLLLAGAAVATLDAGQQATLARGARASVLFPFIRLHESFAERARVAERVEALRAERDSLAREALSMRRLAEQGRQLRDLAGLADPAGGVLVVADLLPGRPRIGDSDIFMLRGAALAAVTPPAAVLTGRGLVGVLRSTDGQAGQGQFWTHPDFRVSVVTADGGISGIVRAVAGADGQPVMLLEGAPYQGDVPPGTELRTSGVAGIYPPGVLVGTVVSVSRVESGWAKSYFVRPAVRPERADVVLVWRRPAPGP